MNENTYAIHRGLKARTQEALYDSPA